MFLLDIITIFVCLSTLYFIYKMSTQIIKKLEEVRLDVSRFDK